jgi:four helix bundle protein
VAVTHFRELVGWQKAMDLVAEVYHLSKCFPADERFGLTNQIRRATVSVPSNIAEGQARRLPRQFAMFLRISKGSTQEVITQLMISVRLGNTAPEQIAPIIELADDVGRLLSGLIRSVEVA